MNKTRLDLFLARQHPQHSRSRIKKLIQDGFVLIDGERKKPGFLLHGGEKIELLRRAPEVPKAEPESIPLKIIFEDEDLLIVDKAAGMVVHPAPGHFHGTLVNAILHHLNKVSGRDLRPGIVHRLDKGTSGVMLVAKNEQAQTALAGQFKNRKVEKRYQALVFGGFAEKRGTIRSSIGRDRQHWRKFSSRTRRAREAVTHFEVLRQFDGIALLLLKPETGRTHQIRVHLSERRHPIVGDTVYGAKGFLPCVKDDSLRALLAAVDRPLLHAWQLGFFHPTRKEKVVFSAPLPGDFQSVLERLKR